MALSQTETFEWMRERLTRIEGELAEAVEDARALRAEYERLRAENVRLALELARLQVKPIVKREREGEEVGAVPGVRLDAS